MTIHQWPRRAGENATMGVRNRERRASKQRKRENRARGTGFGDNSRRGFHRQPSADAELRIQAALIVGVYATLMGDEAGLGGAVQTVARHGARGIRCLGEALVEATAALWEEGWQPADVARVANRRLPEAAGLAEAVLGEQAARAGWGAFDLHVRWRRQLADLGAWPAPARTVDGPLHSWAAATGRDPSDCLASGMRLLAVLDSLPSLPELIAPPGRTRYALDADMPPGLDVKILERIRALLAKAESTTFAEEAEALSAKAQMLMSRHAVDVVLVGAGRGADDCPPLGVRLEIDDPYADAKALLLQEVGQVNRCRVVWSKQLHFATVFGFDDDLTVTELLFTSLLVQASRAMLAAVVAPGPDGRRRTTSFRRSFLAAYATRIGQRLRAADASVMQQAVAEEPAGKDLLPALVALQDRVERVADELFPELVGRSVAVTNQRGWLAGALAGDMADLGAGPALGASASAQRGARVNLGMGPRRAGEERLPGADDWG
jgi:hypothetical protein